MTDAELVQLERRYRELKNRLRDLGFVVPGSVIERNTACGAEGARCHADPARRHGLYCRYTRKVTGETVTRRLNAVQAQR